MIQRKKFLPKLLLLDISKFIVYHTSYYTNYILHIPIIRILSISNNEFFQSDRLNKIYY